MQASPFGPLLAASGLTTMSESGYGTGPARRGTPAPRRRSTSTAPASRAEPPTQGES